MNNLEPTGAVQPRGVTRIVETREAPVGKPLAAICSLQAFPTPSYRLILTFTEFEMLLFFVSYCMMF
jgi:hypothetical protein